MNNNNKIPEWVERYNHQREEFKAIVMQAAETEVIDKERLCEAFQDYFMGDKDIIYNPEYKSKHKPRNPAKRLKEHLEVLGLDVVDCTFSPIDYKYKVMLITAYGANFSYDTIIMDYRNWNVRWGDEEISALDIDGAIRYCTEISKKDVHGLIALGIPAPLQDDAVLSSQCADNYRQFAEWLKDLKRLKEENIRLHKENHKLTALKDDVVHRYIETNDQLVEAKRLLRSEGVTAIKQLKDEGCGR